MNWQSINTVAEAIAFLRTIDVEVIGIWHGWILHGVGKENDDFELTCDSNAELIDYARSERDICLKLCNELGVDTLAEVSERCAYSSMTEADRSESRTPDIGLSRMSAFFVMTVPGGRKPDARMNPGNHFSSVEFLAQRGDGVGAVRRTLRSKRDAQLAFGDVQIGRTGQGRLD